MGELIIKNKKEILPRDFKQKTLEDKIVYRKKHNMRRTESLFNNSKAHEAKTKRAKMNSGFYRRNGGK